MYGGTMLGAQFWVRIEGPTNQLRFFFSSKPSLPPPDLIMTDRVKDFRL